MSLPAPRAPTNPGRRWPPAGPASCARSPAAAAGSPSSSSTTRTTTGWTAGSGPSSTPRSTSRWPRSPPLWCASTRSCRCTWRSSTARGATTSCWWARSAGALRQNPEYRDARDVLAGRGGVPAPAVLGPPDQRMRFDTWQLVDRARRGRHGGAAAAGCDRHRVEDLVLAVNEVATNAVEHGKGDAHLALWTGPGTRELRLRGARRRPARRPAARPARSAPGGPPRPGAVDRSPAVRPAARLVRRRGHARPHPGPAVSARAPP